MTRKWRRVAPDDLTVRRPRRQLGPHSHGTPLRPAFVFFDSTNARRALHSELAQLAGERETYPWST
jgi:hypothetical protein